MHYESPDSASPLITRAVGTGLGGRQACPHPFSSWEILALKFLGLFPQEIGRAVISRFQAWSSLPLATLRELSLATLISARLADYADLEGPFPVITMGASLGGAAAHLALLLGGPFLPQTFVLTLRGGAPDGDVQQYFRQSATLAQTIAARHKDLITIQHYDPVHDGWLTRYANHLRFKLLDLPDIYQDYLREKLAPGGVICYLDCQAEWLRYQVGERSYFQVGGWGDLSAEEYLDGSPRLFAYAQAVGLAKTNWRLPGYPLQRGPESEWGCEPAMTAALQAFCNREGFDFVHLRLPSPHDFTYLAFLAQQHWLQINQLAPTGVLVEMFSQFDAPTVQNANLLPVWLVFNTHDSLATLQRLRSKFPAGLPVWFAPLATFTRTPDLVPWESWEQALAGLDWVNIGARASHYPADAQAVVSWSEKLSQSLPVKSQPTTVRLPPEVLVELAQRASIASQDHR